MVSPHNPKHILSVRCMRRCYYCVTRNMQHAQVVDFPRLRDLYRELREQGYVALMLTGGEPTIAREFERIVALAAGIFDRLYLTTCFHEVLQDDWYGCAFDAITFSIHDQWHRNPTVIPRVTIQAPVYASVVEYLYRSHLPQVLQKLGFAGLTVNEDHRGKGASGIVFPEVEDFSSRLLPKGACIVDRTPMILPDLSLTDDFSQHL